MVLLRLQKNIKNNLMKQFFKFMFASMFGFVLAGVILIFVLIAAITSAVGGASSDKAFEVKEKSILQISLDAPINDRSNENPFAAISKGSFETEKKLGLYHYLRAITNAKTDDKIKGIFLDLETVNAGAASVTEIRNALLDFKKSKKFIIAYAETYTQKSYYLASVATTIYLNPQGNLEWKGLHADLMFFKHALEKLEVEPQIIRHGKFKSAVEPFLADKMSDANRTQTRAFMGDIWKSIVTGIATERKIDAVTLQTYANEMSVQNPDDALKFKLVDKLAYRDEVLAALNKEIGNAAKDKIAFVRIAKYADGIKTEISSNKIAIIYAEGSIVSGKGDDENTGSETIAREIAKAADDEKIKAIVLRVNSPGGSALASDVIWRETKLAATKKPLIVSMGNVAASGGYYISCGAQRIFAEPTTITGSIGVFGLLFNMEKLLNNKLGVTIDTVKTAPMADIGSGTRSMTAQERTIIQNSVERVYATFIGRVAEGRKKSTADIDSIGQGRVWSGEDAKDLGLVDEFGGLQDAINYASKKANVDKYRIVELPKSKNPLEQMFNKIDDETEVRVMQNQLGRAYPYYKKLNNLLQLKGVQARMDYDVEIY